MNNRRLALLISLCAVLLGFAVAKQPPFTSAKALLTQTPSPSGPTATATAACFPRSTNSQLQARVPNLTATPTPNGTSSPTATVDPCFVQPELILSGPSQVAVGQVFTLSIQYINLGMPYTSIGFNDNNLAQFDPPLTMPCKSNEHPTGCGSITIRATQVGTLVINATATGESYNHGWYWGWGSARAPLTITIFNPNGNQTITPTPTCVVNPATPTPYGWVTPTYTPTSARQRVPNLTATFPPTATPNDPCFIEPKVIISAPSQVGVGELFTISIQYINLASPFTYLDINGNSALFEPPLTNEYCIAEQHPTQCSSFTMRAASIGVFQFDVGVLGEAYYNGGWHTIWIDAQAPVFINIVEGVSTSTPTFTPVPTCVPATTTPIPTMIPPFTPTLAGQATSTPTPTKTRTPTPTAATLPCYQTSYAELVLSAPNQVQVGNIFTLTIDYVNFGAITTSINLTPNSLAQFDPPLPMPCRIAHHNSACRQIPLRATALGELTITANSKGTLFINNHWVEDAYTSARNPIYVNIIPRIDTPTPTSTGTPTATLPTSPCFTPTTQPLNSNGVQTTQVPCTPTPTFTPTSTTVVTPCPTNLALNAGVAATPCPGTPTSTPTSGSPTPTPLVKELILSAPAIVNVGDVFSLTIQYVNIGVPYTGITLSPTGTVQFDPPLTMPCKYNQHPTQCRTIGLRAVAPGTIEIDAGATGEVPVAGGGWAWGSAHARNPINVHVRNVLAHKLFIPVVKTQ